MLKIFIGVDAREVAAYHVLCHSIMRQASGPVCFIPLIQSQLRQSGFYTRPSNPLESTEFSLTRFLVPALCKFGDYALFLDCDMLCQGDIYDLVKIVKADELRAVWCVKHDYEPSSRTKMDGIRQTTYPRKNWSSVMLFRNKFCERLTPQYVNTATPLDLHRMVWAGADENIGELPLEWNFLVGEENQSSKTPQLIHFTNGGPWFRDYQFTDYANNWFQELDKAVPSMNHPSPYLVKA